MNSGLEWQILSDEYQLNTLLFFSVLVNIDGIFVAHDAKMGRVMSVKGKVIIGQHDCFIFMPEILMWHLR